MYGKICSSWLLFSLICLMQAAEIPLKDSAEFKAELEKILKRKPRQRSSTNSGIVVRAESSNAEDEALNRSKSASPSIKRSKIRSTSSIIKLDKSIKQIDELIFQIKHSEDIVANKRMLAHALAILLKPYWFEHKKNAESDIEKFFLIIGSATQSLADFVQNNHPVELIKDESIKGKMYQLINLPISSTGLTLLLDASKKPRENFILIEKLLLVGADVTVKDIFSNTVFHYIAKGTAYKEDDQAVKDAIALFVKYGGNSNEQDELGKTPLDWATKLNSPIIIEALKNFGSAEI